MKPLFKITVSQTASQAFLNEVRFEEFHATGNHYFHIPAMPNPEMSGFLSRRGHKRIVITGMSVISTLGDTLETFHSSLLQGKSVITCWKNPLYPGSCSRFSGDLSEYDIDEKMSCLRGRIPPFGTLTSFYQITIDSIL